MDAFTSKTLSRVHSTLFNDLNEIAQLARKQGADGVYDATGRALDHLRDLEPIMDPTPNIQFRKAQCDAGYSRLDIVDLLIDRLEGAEALCDMMSVVAEAEHSGIGSDLCDTTMHRAAFTARTLVTECLEKTKVWNAQHADRGTA